MYSKEKLLEMLSSEKASTRYDACEWLWVSQESSPEIVTALEKATHDLDKEVAEIAKLALQTDVHHQMAIKIGIVEPTNLKIRNIQQVRDQPSVIEPTHHKFMNTEAIHRKATNNPLSEGVTYSFQQNQIITIYLFLCSAPIGLCLLVTQPSIFIEAKCISIIILGTIFPFLGFQIYSIIKYGFEDSFSFLKHMHWSRGRGHGGGK
jgi:hypothetical protein